jgi:hypothetical protein
LNVSIQTNLPELEALWTRSSEICTEELQTSVLEALALLEREVIELTPRGATSTLRNQVTSVMTTPVPLDTGDVLGMVTGTAPHTVPVELGSRPHAVPIEPLVDWVAAKLGKTGKEGRSIAFAISRKIAKYGTKGAAMFRRSMQVNNNEYRVEQILLGAVPRIIDRLTVAGL